MSCFVGNDNQLLLSFETSQPVAKGWLPAFSRLLIVSVLPRTTRTKPTQPVGIDCPTSSSVDNTGGKHERPAPPPPGTAHRFIIDQRPAVQRSSAPTLVNQRPGRIVHFRRAARHAAPRRPQLRSTSTVVLFSPGGQNVRGLGLFLLDPSFRMYRTTVM